MIPEGRGPADEAQQAAVSAVADQDAYNWGYRPALDGLEGHVP